MDVWKGEWMDGWMDGWGTLQRGRELLGPFGND